MQRITVHNKNQNIFCQAHLQYKHTHTYQSGLYIELALESPHLFATLWSKCVFILLIKITGSIIILEVSVFLTGIEPHTHKYNRGDS